jgi:hypothetical protein
MAAMTYYVALAFKRSEDGGDIVADDPKEARSAEQAIRIAIGCGDPGVRQSQSFGLRQHSDRMGYTSA